MAKSSGNAKKIGLAALGLAAGAAYYFRQSIVHPAPGAPLTGALKGTMVNALAVLLVRAAPGAASPIVGSVNAGPVQQDTAPVADDGVSDPGVVGGGLSHSWIHITDTAGTGSPPGVSGFVTLGDANGAEQISS